MFSELSYFLLIGTLFGIGCFYLKFLCGRLGIQETQQAGFSGSLEALRGMAAFLVFGAHSTMYFGMAPERIVAGAMGEIGVLLFFMLTGHLFWSQIKAGKLELNSFFAKRIRRLFPIMILVIATYSFMDWVLAGFPRPDLHQLLGIVRNFGFGFGRVVSSLGDVNDVFSKNMYLKINVIWSLRWEWLFYLCMPIFAALGSFRKITVFAVLIVLMFMDPFQFWSGGTDAVFVMAFWLGALGRSLEDYRDGILAKLFTRKAACILLIIGIAAIGYYLLGSTPLVRKSVRIPYLVMLIFPVFFFFVASKHFESRLTWSPLQLMGKISYSFYLWHLGINFFVIHAVGRLFRDFGNSVPCFIIACTVAMFVGLTLSAITFRFVETPFLSKSKHVYV